MASLFYPATVVEVRAALAEGVALALDASRAMEAADRGEFAAASVHFAAVLERATDERLLFAGFQFHFRRQEFALAEQFVRRRLALAERGSALMARILTNLGLIHFFRDELAESESAFRAAIEIDRANGDDTSLARDMGNLALVPEKRGALDEAEALYRDALAIAERVGAKAIIATKLANLGDIALTRGNRDEARSLWTRAESVFAELGNEKYRAEMAGKLRELDAK